MSKKDVINYYNETTMLWLKYYGNNIQVFKLKDDINCVKTLNYLNKKLNIQENDLIFDVGCGIAAASIYFAKKIKNTKYLGITISPRQVEIAKKFIKDENLEKRISVYEKDYHNIPKNIKGFDKAFLFESLCYSDNVNLAIKQISKAIKPNGVIVIKDLFLNKKLSEVKKQELKALNIFKNIYKMQILSDIDGIKKLLTNKGFKDIEIEILDYKKWDISQYYDSMMDITCEEVLGGKIPKLNPLGIKHIYTKENGDPALHVEHLPLTWAIIKAKKNNK